MDTKTIPLSRLETDVRGMITECADTGRVLIVELPDHRLIAIQSLDPTEDDDDLTSQLLESNPRFRALIAKSNASPREPLIPELGK
jgi:hypothetical protein